MTLRFAGQTQTQTQASAAESQSPRATPACLRRPSQTAGAVAVVVLVNFKPAAVPWAWSRLVLQGLPLLRVPGLRFCKVLGSGQGGGFGVVPSSSHQGLFLSFDDETQAREFVAQSPLLQRYRARAQDCFVAVLRASSSRGSWSGRRLDVSAQPLVGRAEPGPLAALTRASIQPLRARAFWRLSPAAESALAQAPGCRLAVGLGEMPLLRQATFSLWDSTAAMNAYARSGAHLQAIRASYGGAHFSEAMFVRFVPLLVQGSWQGRSMDGWLADAATASATAASTAAAAAAAAQPAGISHD